MDKLLVVLLTEENLLLREESEIWRVKGKDMIICLAMDATAI